MFTSPMIGELATTRRTDADCRCRRGAACPAGTPRAPRPSRPGSIDHGRTGPPHLAADDHPTGTFVTADQTTLPPRAVILISAVLRLRGPSATR